MRESDLAGALDAAVPRFGVVDEGWEDVLRRASERAGPSRPILVLAVAVALLLFAASAYALARHFSVGDPAPAEIRREADVLNAADAKGLLLARLEPDVDVVVAELRLGARLESTFGTVYLWVAPDTDGHECRYVQEAWRPARSLAGGCGQLHDRVQASYGRSNEGEGRWLQLLDGSVPRGAGAASVQVRLADGGSERLDLERGRHFLVELSSRPTLVRALDARGREVGRLEFPEPAVVSEAVGPFRTLIAFETVPRRKPVSLAVAPGEGGTQCVLIRAGGLSSSCASWPELEPGEIQVNTMQVGAAPAGLLMLEGRVGRAVASLDLRYEDGTVDELPVVEGWTLSQVTRDHLAAGRRPDVLVARDDNGAVIGRKSLGPWAP